MGAMVLLRDLAGESFPSSDKPNVPIRAPLWGGVGAFKCSRDSENPIPLNSGICLTS